MRRILTGMLAMTLLCGTACAEGKTAEDAIPQEYLAGVKNGGTV